MSGTELPRSACQHLEREHGVRNGDVFEELVSRLEVGQQRTDRALVAGRRPTSRAR